MERNDLINEITDFFVEYGLLSKSVNIDEIKSKIDEQLNDIPFIESLINTIILKTRNGKAKNYIRIIKLLAELEKVRLELEYMGYVL